MASRPSIEIVHPAIEEYLKSLAPEADPVLREMEALAESRRFPIVGPLVGRLLTLLALAIRAGRILELGSGYSASGPREPRANGMRISRAPPFCGSVASAY
ncbi:MAG: hypothetical protein HY725_03020 [Candidatus Rokubacteria bacterium]|nr:hypothetical protein [Candidatus Rokubacteria bacterium]